MDKLFFKVKIGYGQNDFILIDEDDYAKAVRAQVTSKVAIFKTGQTVSGSIIQAVLPNYSKVLGYRPEYEVPYSEVPKSLLKKYAEFGKSVQLGIEGEIKRLN